MNTNEVLIKLRKENNLSQSQFANKLFITRQAVSRWENGKTVPNNQTLINISKLFNVSVNSLLGEADIVCQSCGMPLSKELFSIDKNGKVNEDYCKWCYHDGQFTYNSSEELIKACIPMLVQQGFSKEQAESYMNKKVPTLRHWNDSAK